MAASKRRTPRKAEPAEPAPQVTPLPFPGESPTVSLAMAAGQMYGFHPEDEKPVRASPKRRGTAKAKKKAVAPRRAAAKKAPRRGTARARAR